MELGEKQYMVDLPPEVHKFVKAYGAIHDKSINEVIVGQLIELMEDERNSRIARLAQSTTGDLKE